VLYKGSRRGRIYIFNQPTRLHRCAGIVRVLVKSLQYKVFIKWKQFKELVDNLYKSFGQQRVALM